MSSARGNYVLWQNVRHSAQDLRANILKSGKVLQVEDLKQVQTCRCTAVYADVNVLHLLLSCSTTRTHPTGYANEVGEAFRSIVPKFVVHASYGIASLYVLADTYDKTKKADQKERLTKNYDVKKVAKIAVDTLSWQALASVIIPGFVINRLCALSLFALCRARVPANTAKWTTTAIGLSSIPFIVHPIDRSVDYAFDKTLRPLLGIPPKHSD